MVLANDLICFHYFLRSLTFFGIGFVAYRNVASLPQKTP